MNRQSNPLFLEKDLDFLLYEVLQIETLCKLPAFSSYSREEFELVLQSAKRLAREELLPSYKAIDESPPVFENGSVTLHPMMKDLYAKLLSLGLLNATRPETVGGMQLPFTIASLAQAYLMAGNLSAFGFLGLTTGAAHLIEAFGSEETKEMFMSRMYAGEWTGTMALTETHAGSSLADITCTARKTEGGHYLLKGAKIFISGGDHDLTENIVHMTLARIPGSPPGIKGVSLFAVPKKRLVNNKLHSNDVTVSGVIHKIGWRGIPSLAINFGDADDCYAWLIGNPNHGIRYMFQMMNEARIMVGLNAVATASVAYHESLSYARERRQGRHPGSSPDSLQIPIIEHLDVKRMLLRQKAIVEGGLSLVASTAKYLDLSVHAASKEEKLQSSRLLNLLTPIAKSFPAEWGFESNTLALQIHGGYGYSSEFLPEAWLRDQKLNSIHEGTTGIQGLDLLGRKVVAENGAALLAFQKELQLAVERAERAGVNKTFSKALTQAMEEVSSLTMELAQFALSGNIDAMLLHSHDYLTLFSILVVSWQWLLQATAAEEGFSKHPDKQDFYQGKRLAAQYWFSTELPRVSTLVDLCRSGENSYQTISF